MNNFLKEFFINNRLLKQRKGCTWTEIKTNFLKLKHTTGSCCMMVLLACSLANEFWQFDSEKNTVSKALTYLLGYLEWLRSTKTAPWPSRDSTTVVNSLSPQMIKLVEDAIAS